jgi:hypothetical protein
MKRLSIAAALLILFGLGGLFLMHFRPQASQPVPLMVSIDNETTVPLMPSRNNVLCVWGNVERRRVLCTIDTGTFLTQWPQSLALAGIPLHTAECIKVSDYTGQFQPGRTEILPEVKIGGYTLCHVLTLALDHRDPDPAADPGSVLTLGSSTLAGSVVTIDCRARTLTLRSHRYNPTAIIAPGDSLISFHWVHSDPLLPGVPAIYTHINGHVAELLLDTGSHDVTLSTQFAMRCLPPYTVLPSRVEQSVESPTHVAIGQIAIETDGVNISPYDENGTDGILGLGGILDIYRVTIDYPRRRMLLEPYGKGTSS